MAIAAPERRFLRICDVAARLNCSESTVRRLVDRGLPALRLGHKNCSLRVDPLELEAWLFSNGDGCPVLLHPPAERRGVGPRPLAGPGDAA